MICLISPLNRFQIDSTYLRKYDTASRHRAFVAPSDLSRRSSPRLDLRRNSSRQNMLVSSKDEDPIEIAMNGGDGPFSYAENSAYQVYNNHAYPRHASSSNVDTLAVETIVEAAEHKFKSQAGLDAPFPEIEVLFNDHTANDFKTLFTCLPPERRYYATAVPGSFYGRLFPKASIHIAYSSCTLCWLSRIPKEVTDETSPAWNRGSIHYDNGARKEVFQAYEAQFAIDMKVFLQARAKEIVQGGLMALLVAAAPNTMPDGVTTLATEFEVLGSCLVDMTKQGMISEEKVNSFNLPLYYTRPEELKELIIDNGNFSIERMEIMDNKKEHVAMPNVKRRTLFLRACFEGLFGQHFGYEVVDEIFDRYAEKVAVSSFYLKPENQKTLMLFVLLKRNVE